jgi:hypothetical protein
MKIPAEYSYEVLGEMAEFFWKALWEATKFGAKRGSKAFRISERYRRGHNAPFFSQ